MSKTYYESQIYKPQTTIFDRPETLPTTKITTSTSTTTIEPLDLGIYNYKEHVLSTVEEITHCMKALYKEGGRGTTTATQALAPSGKAIGYANKKLWPLAKVEIINACLNWTKCYLSNSPYSYNNTFESLLKEIPEDISHHFEKYGEQRLDLANWLMVIDEEVGEVIEAWLEVDKSYGPANFCKETKQVVACWMRFYNEIDRISLGHAEREASQYVKAV